MARVLFEGGLHVHYGYFYLSAGSEPDDIGRARQGQANGLCGARIAHQLSMTTGLHTGEIPLRVEWSATEPPLDADWEDVVEVSVEFTINDGLLSAFEDFRDLNLPAIGWHRVRYSAKGMDEGSTMDTHDSDEGEIAPDRYLIQLWPAASAPDRVVAVGSDRAAYWHGVAARSG